MKRSMVVAPELSRWGSLRVFLAFCLAMLTTLGLVVQGYEAGQVGEVIVSLILILGATSVLYGLVVALAFDRQCRLTRKLFRELGKAKLREVRERHEGGKGMVLRVVKGIDAQHRRDPSAVDVDSHLSSLEERFHEPVKWLSMAAKWAAGLGFIGTAAGLLTFLEDMTASIAQAAELGGPAIMVEVFGEGGAAANVGAAFTTTIAGTAAGLLIGTIALGLSTQGGRLIEHVEVLIKTYIIPALGDWEDEDA